jgi:hypothetical protein
MDSKKIEPKQPKKTLTSYRQYVNGKKLFVEAESALDAQKKFEELKKPQKQPKLLTKSNG